MLKVIKKENWKESIWDGGKTNELFIFPEDGNYQKRDFKARISIASADSDEKANFTYLPSVKRYISPIEGEIQLFHEGHYNTNLKQYEIDRFSGDWSSYSLGKFQDFNLMLKDVIGDLYFKEINEDTTLNLQKNLTRSFLFILEGNLILNEQEFSERDLIISDLHIFNVSGNKTKIFYGFIQEI